MKNLKQRLAAMRRDYSGLELDERSVMKDPIRQFSFWMEQAVEAELTDANAVTLATAGANDQPDVRIVLLRSADKLGFTFYTNYNSRKGVELSANKKACMNFFWPELQRQVRILGTISKLPGRVSDKYFASRPRESQLGAWASDQSSVIPNRQSLLTRYDQAAVRFRGKEVPRPPYWGGYLLKPSSLEFWQGRASRLHDRILFEKKKDSRWQISRLAP